MKKILVLLAAFSLSAGISSAQVAPAKTQFKTKTDHAAKARKTPEQRADHAAQNLTQKLSLSPAQTAQVRELHLARHQEMQVKRAQYAATTDKEKRREGHQDLKASKAQYEAKLKQILTAEQYTKYAQLRAEKAEKHKGHRKAKS